MTHVDDVVRLVKVNLQLFIVDFSLLILLWGVHITQIQGKLGSGEPIDVDYWEGLLKKLIVWKAKVCLSAHLCSGNCSTPLCLG